MMWICEELPIFQLRPSPGVVKWGGQKDRANQFETLPRTD